MYGRRMADEGKNWNITVASTSLACHVRERGKEVSTFYPLAIQKQTAKNGNKNIE